MEWLVVVEISATLFQPARSGSHLIFRTPTPRAVEDFVSKDLLALVGTHLLWSPCIPHLYLDYITNLAICQDLF